MRSQSEQVRLIIANLYIRVRIARANASVANTIYGMGSLKAETLKSERRAFSRHYLNAVGRSTGRSTACRNRSSQC